MQKINLGDLAISGDTLFQLFQGVLPLPGESDSWDGLAAALNKLLAERLGRAPVISPLTSSVNGDEYYEVSGMWVEREPNAHNTHTARLLCVEALEKKDEKE